MKKTFWDKLEQFPPIVCRLLARVKTETGGVRAMTVEEIAKRARLDPMTVQSMSWLTSWNNVSMAHTRAFIEGCCVDLTSRESLRTHTAYIRKASWKYLKQSPDWERVFKPMIKAYVTGKL